MEGLVQIEKLHCGDLTDADFEQAKREGRLKELLQGLPLVQKVECKNRIFDNMAAYILDRLFSCATLPDPYGNTSYGPQAALSYIFFLQTDDDTDDYEENSVMNYTVPYNPADGCVNGGDPSLNGMQRFVEDEVDPFQIWTDANREAIHFKDWWLYLPVKMVHSNIRSLGIFFSSDGDNTTGSYRYQGRIARVRLKDAQGNKIILSKSIHEVLRVSYQFTLVAV